MRHCKYLDVATRTYALSYLQSGFTREVSEQTIPACHLRSEPINTHGFGTGIWRPMNEWARVNILTLSGNNRAEPPRARRQGGVSR